MNGYLGVSCLITIMKTVAIVTSLLILAPLLLVALLSLAAWAVVLILEPYRRVVSGVGWMIALLAAITVVPSFFVSGYAAAIGWASAAFILGVVALAVIKGYRSAAPR